MILKRLFPRIICSLAVFVSAPSAFAQFAPPEPPPLVAESSKQPKESSDEPDGDAESSTADLEKRLKELEDQWKERQESDEKKKAEAAKKPTFDIGGRVQLDYWSFLQDSDGIGYFEHPDADDPAFGTDPENRLKFRRIRIEAQGEIPDRMFWRLQVDFNEPSEPQMKDVYLGWYLPGNRKLLVGNSKRPIGLDAWNSSRFTVFIERPLAVAAFNPGPRRAGVRMENFRDDLSMSWQYGVFGLENVENVGEFEGDSFQPGLYGRVAATPWYDETSGGRGYWHLGLAGSIARPDGDVSPADSNENEARFRTRPQARTDGRWIDTRPIAGAETFEQMGLETAVNVGAVQFVGEYLTTWVQRDDTTPDTGPNTFFHGGYVQASYFLTGEHMPWDRETGQLDRVHPFENFFLVERCRGGLGGGWGAWQVAARYGYLDLTDADIRGGVQNDLTLGMNWWWNPNARVQFNMTRGFVNEHREIGGFEEGDFWLAGTRFAVDF